MKEYQKEQEQQQIPSSTAKSKRNTAARDENIIHLAPRDPELQDLLRWNATIRGPKEGFYDGEQNTLARKFRMYHLINLGSCIAKEVHST